MQNLRGPAPVVVTPPPAGRRPSEGRGTSLIGRREESGRIERLLEDARGSAPGALVLCGDPGIGKTALVEAVAASAHDFGVTRAVGVESEVRLGYAGLHQILTPFLGRVAALPGPQATALRAAFGMIEAPSPDRFLLGLAALSLLVDAAAPRPLLCVVDDAQWLDRDSLELLAFAARRLHTTRVAMLFSLRDPEDTRGELHGLPQLRLGELSDAAAHALLDAVPSRRLDPRVRGHLVALAGGNPLALIEFAAELTPDQRAGRRPMPEPPQVGASLRRRFARQAADLTAAAQTFALLAAAEPSSNPALLWRAAGELGIGPEDASAAELDALLRLTPDIEFRHPLIRSAIYADAPDARRRQAHAALAAATDPATDADRRAWHLAAAAVAPDESVARELERGAERAHRRGGYSASSTFLDRAARLTPDEGRRAARLLSAGQAELLAGASTRAEHLLEEAAPWLTDPRHHALALQLEGRIQFAKGRPDAAPPRLLQAAKILEGVDADLARDTFLEALQATFFAGRIRGRDARLDVAAAAQAARPAPPARGDVADLLLDGFAARLAGEPATGAALLHAAIAALRRDALGPDERLRWLLLGCAAAGDLLDDDGLFVLARRWVQIARDAGALSALPLALVFLARSELLNGRFDAAERCVAEEREIVRLTGNPGVVGRASYGELFVKALRGREAEARTAAADTVRDSLERGQGAGLMFAQFALAMLELGLGRFRAARDCARRLYDDDALYMGTHALPILVEAAVKAGDPETARPALDRLATRALASGTPLALGLLARSRALLADAATAEDGYVEAIDLIAGTRASLELARSRLLYGEWLRARDRDADAQEQLVAARSLFAEMGAHAFAVRAEAALGPRAPAAAPRSDEPLTEREMSILRLLATNLTLGEIAAERFVSANTVKTHTQRIYRKLGVHRRGDAVRQARALGLLART